MNDHLKRYITDIPDFPKPGIVFRDISPLLGNPTAFRHVVSEMAQHVRDSQVSSVVAVESRGFIFGAAVAHEAELPLFLVRKPGKLPGEVVRVEYGLEYGTDALELKSDLLARGSRVTVVDDVLATGGTARATGELIEKVGASVGSFIFLAELLALGGRNKLGNTSVHSLIHY